MLGDLAACQSGESHDYNHAALKLPANPVRLAESHANLRQ